MFADVTKKHCGTSNMFRILPGNYLDVWNPFPIDKRLFPSSSMGLPTDGGCAKNGNVNGVVPR